MTRWRARLRRFAPRPGATMRGARGRHCEPGTSSAGARQTRLPREVPGGVCVRAGCAGSLPVEGGAGVAAGAAAPPPMLGAWEGCDGAGLVWPAASPVTTAPVVIVAPAPGRPVAGVPHEEVAPGRRRRLRSPSTVTTPPPLRSLRAPRPPRHTRAWLGDGRRRRRWGRSGGSGLAGVAFLPARVAQPAVVPAGVGARRWAGCPRTGSGGAAVGRARRGWAMCRSPREPAAAWQASSRRCGGGGGGGRRRRGHRHGGARRRPWPMPPRRDRRAARNSTHRRRHA